MSIEDFSSTAQKCANRLLEAIAEYENELQIRIAEKRKKDRLSLLGLGFAAALGISSIAVPALAIPATVVGVAAGTESIRSTINKHLAKKRP